MSEIYYESAGNRHRLRLIERRGARMGLFEDLDASAPSRVLCHLNAVDLLPRGARPTTLEETHVAAGF